MDEKLKNKFSNFKSDPNPESKIDIFAYFFTTQPTRIKEKKSWVDQLKENKYRWAMVMSVVLLSFGILISKNQSKNKSSDVLLNEKSTPPINSAIKSEVLSEPSIADVKTVTNENTTFAFSSFGKRRSITLPDGSTVFLNKHSEISYSENIEKKERIVQFSGEGYFDVKKKDNQVFIIHTSNSEIKVLGTSFNVKALPREREEIIVENGTVLFLSKLNSTKTSLKAGDKGYFDLINRIIKVKFDDPNELSWKKKRLVFHEAPIKKVIHDVEKYFEISVNVPEHKILKCHFTGSFETPSVEEVLKVVSMSINGNYSINGREYSLKGKGCK